MEREKKTPKEALAERLIKFGKGLCEFGNGFGKIKDRKVEIGLKKFIGVAVDVAVFGSMTAIVRDPKTGRMPGFNEFAVRLLTTFPSLVTLSAIEILRLNKLETNPNGAPTPEKPLPLSSTIVLLGKTIERMGEIMKPFKATTTPKENTGKEETFEEKWNKAEKALIRNGLTKEMIGEIKKRMEVFKDFNQGVKGSPEAGEGKIIISDREIYNPKTDLKIPSCDPDFWLEEITDYEKRKGWGPFLRPDGIKVFIKYLDEDLWAGLKGAREISDYFLLRPSERANILTKIGSFKEVPKILRPFLTFLNEA